MLGLSVATCLEERGIAPLLLSRSGRHVSKWRTAACDARDRFVAAVDLVLALVFALVRDDPALLIGKPIVGAGIPGFYTALTYRIAPERGAEFIAALHALAVVRRRDGARHWRLYRDLGNRDCYAERFVVESWGEYERQKTRATMTNALAEKRVRGFHVGDESVRVSQFIAVDKPRVSKMYAADGEFP